MLTILKYRVLLITAIFGAFGGALSLLLKVEDLKSYYPSLAALIALIVSLLISFLIKARWNTRHRNKLKIVSALLFGLFLATAFFHTYYVINDTFEYREFAKMTRYVKGEYTQAAINYKKGHPAEEDIDALKNYFGGTAGIGLFWTRTSINNNIFKLIVTYCCLVMFFVGAVSLVTEVLASKYSKSTKRVHS